MQYSAKQRQNSAVFGKTETKQCSIRQNSAVFDKTVQYSTRQFNIFFKTENIELLTVQHFLQNWEHRIIEFSVFRQDRNIENGHYWDTVSIETRSVLGQGQYWDKASIETRPVPIQPRPVPIQPRPVPVQPCTPTHHPWGQSDTREASQTPPWGHVWAQTRFTRLLLDWTQRAWWTSYWPYSESSGKSDNFRLCSNPTYRKWPFLRTFPWKLSKMAVLTPFCSNIRKMGAQAWGTGIHFSRKHGENGHFC